MNEKKRLGKGLGALLPGIDDDVPEKSNDIKEIPLNMISPNPYQPRKEFNQEKLQELAESIREHGIIQPVMLTPCGEEKYYIVTGERRWRASKIAGLEHIPAIIREVEDQTLLQVALIENLQREDLNPIEEAMAYQKLMDQFSYTQDQLSKRIGKSRSTIANTLRLLLLPERVKQALSTGALTEGQARPLLSIKDFELQNTLCEKVLYGNYSSREVENLVSKVISNSETTNSEDEKTMKKKGKSNREDQKIFYQDLKENLQKYLGTKVKIKENKKGGSIEIVYFGDEDLNRLVSLIMKELNSEAEEAVE